MAIKGIPSIIKAQRILEMHVFMVKLYAHKNSST
jgi:hypothetical protein